MKIYVVETVLDELTQIGFSQDEKIALQKADELHKKYPNDIYWVTEYTIGKNKFCYFD